MLTNISFVEPREGIINPRIYGERVKAAKFTVSPPGYGWDCHRTWESILLGSIPIVLLSPHYQQLFSEAPLMAVKDWKSVTRDDLYNFKAVTSSKNFVFVDHWLEKIQQAKKNF